MAIEGQNNFIVDFVKTFDATAEAAKYENIYQRFVHADQNDNYLNICISGGENYGKYNQLVSDGEITNPCKDFIWINNGKLNRRIPENKKFLMVSKKEYYMTFITKTKNVITLTE